MTKPRRSTPEDRAEVERILDEHPEIREQIAQGPQPRQSGLLGGEEHARHLPDGPTGGGAPTGE